MLFMDYFNDSVTLLYIADLPDIILTDVCLKAGAMLLNMRSQNTNVGKRSAAL